MKDPVNLWINLITDTYAEISLSPVEGYVEYSLRKKETHICLPDLEYPSEDGGTVRAPCVLCGAYMRPIVWKRIDA